MSPSVLHQMGIGCADLVETHSPREGICMSATMESFFLPIAKQGGRKIGWLVGVVGFAPTRDSPTGF